MFCASLLVAVVAIAWLEVDAEKDREMAAAAAERVIDAVRQESEKTAEIVRISTQQASAALQQQLEVQGAQLEAQAINDAEQLATRLADSQLAGAAQSVESEKQESIRNTNREVCEYWQNSYRKDGSANSLNFRDQACARAGIRPSLE